MPPRRRSVRRFPRARVPTADEIADVVVAREAAARKIRQRRQISGLAIVVAVAAAVFFVPRAIRPAADASLQIAQAAATQEVDVSGAQSMQLLSGHAQLRALGIDALPEPGASHGIVELVLPTSPASCTQLAGELGGACDNRVPRRQAAANVSVESTQTAEVSIASSHLHGVSIEGNLVTHAIMQVSAPVSVVTIRCKVPGERLRITTLGRTLDLTRCLTPASGILRLALEYPTPPQLTLITLGALHLEIPGNATMLSTRQASLVVGSQRQSVARAAPVPVALHAASAGFLTLDSMRHDPGSALIVDAHGVDRVTVAAGANIVPTVFDEHRTAIYTALGILGGLIASTIVLLFASRHSLR